MTRLAHIECRFDYQLQAEGRDDQAIVEAVKQIVIAGLWRSALSSFPEVQVILVPLPEQETSTHG